MSPTRRTLLQASALGLAASVAGCAGASGNRQETETTADGEDGTTTVGAPEETVVLGGETSHWFGLAPSPIHGAENPTLGLQPGTVYELVWINLDGHEHELRVFDADDDVVAATEATETVGETRSVVLEAAESLASYDCEYHPQSMRGQVAQAAMTTTAGTATAGTTTADGGGSGGDGGGGGGGDGGGGGAGPY